MKNTVGSPSDLIIDLTKFSSSIVPSTTPRIVGATGNPFSSITNAISPKTRMITTPNTELLIANEPTMQNSRMIGIRMLRATFSSLVARRTVSQPSGTMTRLARMNTRKIA